MTPHKLLLLLHQATANIVVPSPAAITPTLSSELLTNGNMETGDPPSSWNAYNGASLDGVADERTGGAGIQSIEVTRGTSSLSCGQPKSSATGRWHYMTGWGKAGTGSARICCTTGVSWYSNVAAATWTELHNAGPIISGSTLWPQLIVQASAGTTGYFDDISCKRINPFVSMCGTFYKGAADYTAQIEVTLLATGVPAGMILSVDDSSNPTSFLLALHNGNNACLLKCVAGTYTSLIDDAATYGAGRILKVIKSGTSVALYYNGSQIGTTQTVSDAQIINNQYHTWFSTHASNTFANFSVIK